MRTPRARRPIPAAAILAAAVLAVGVGPRVVGPVAAAQAQQQRPASVPTFQADPSWPKLPARWKLGDVTSVAVDAQDHVWVLHRPQYLPADQLAMAAPPVLEFDGAGNVVQAWGGTSAGYEWPEREHGIHVDYKGYVWIGGNNCPARQLPGLKALSDDQLLKFTKAGKLVMQFGHSTKSGGNSDTIDFHNPADAFVYQKTNEVFVADGYGNRRVIVLDADSGAFRRMWGGFGNKRKTLEVLGSFRGASAHHIAADSKGNIYTAETGKRRAQKFVLQRQS